MQVMEVEDEFRTGALLVGQAQVGPLSCVSYFLNDAFHESSVSEMTKLPLEEGQVPERHAQGPRSLALQLHSRDVSWAWLY